MKLQNPQWRFESPGPLSDNAYYAFSNLAQTIAGQGRHIQDLLEDFKWRFSNGKSSRSSSESWAETDLQGYMREAAVNAPLFIATFMDACSDIREQGYDVPDITRINNMLYHSGVWYHIDNDTVMSGTSYTAVPDSITDPEEVIVSDADDSVLALPIVTVQTAGTAPVMVSTEPPVTIKKPVLRVFLCHSSPDKVTVRVIYRKLRNDGYEPWLDEEDLVPGQDWQVEIPKAIKACHVFLACLSSVSLTRPGYLHKEIKFALDVADEQPEGRIFIIPARLNECDIPNRLSRWQWVNLFDEKGYEKLLTALAKRAKDL